MDIRQVTPTFSVAGQIAPADVARLAAMGFKTIISNRPDQESFDQPSTAAIAEAARAAGLDWRHVPVTPGNILDEDVAAFAAALTQVQGPVLAFCRTGNRSVTLWALAEARSQKVTAILAAANRAGYDLSGCVQRLVNIAQAAS